MKFFHETCSQFKLGVILVKINVLKHLILKPEYQYAL